MLAAGWRSVKPGIPAKHQVLGPASSKLAGAQVGMRIVRNGVGMLYHPENANTHSGVVACCGCWMGQADGAGEAWRAVGRICPCRMALPLGVVSWSAPHAREVGCLRRSDPRT